MKSLATKLLEVQKEVGAIKKDATNPFFKSKYADINSFIDVVKPILSKHGVVLLQPLNFTGVIGNDKQEIENQVVPTMSTILIDAETGEKLEYQTPLPVGTDPQKNGSTITYYRRYALQSMLFLQAEDDDGNSAKGDIKNDNDEF